MLDVPVIAVCAVIGKATQLHGLRVSMTTSSSTPYNILILGKHQSEMVCA